MFVVEPGVWEDFSVVDIIFDTDVSSGVPDTLNVWEGDAVNVVVFEPDVMEDVRVDDIIVDTYVNSGDTETLVVWDMLVEPKVEEDVRVGDIIFDPYVTVTVFEVEPEVWEDFSVVDIIFDTDVNSGVSDTLNVWDWDAVTVLVVEPEVREEVSVDDITFDSDVNSGVSDTLNVWDVVDEPEVEEDVRVDDIIFDRDVMSGILELLSVWYEDAVIDVEWDPVELSTNSWSWSIVSSRSSFVSRRESFKEFKALRSIVLHESTVLLSICDANNSIVDTWDKSLEIESNVVTTATNSEQDKIFITLWFKTSLIWFVTFSIEDVILSRFSILFIIWDWLMVVETEFVKVEYVELIDPGKVKDVCGCELELVDLNLVLLPVEAVE